MIDGVTEIVFVADVVDRSFTIPEIFVCTLCTPGLLNTTALIVIVPPVATSYAVTVVTHGADDTVPISTDVSASSL